MADEFDDLDLDLAPEAPRRPPGSRRTWPYALLAIALALACAYLLLERYQNVTAVGRLTRQVARLEGKQTESQDIQNQVSDALVELAEYAASEAELHHGLGDRTQALADLDRAMHVLDLAKDLGKCVCGGTPTKRVNNKLKELIALVEPTEEELPRLALGEYPQTPKQNIEPNTSRSGSPPPVEPKPKPRGEPDA